MAHTPPRSAPWLAEVGMLLLTTTVFPLQALEALLFCRDYVNWSCGFSELGKMGGYATSGGNGSQGRPVDGRKKCLLQMKVNLPSASFACCLFALVPRHTSSYWLLTLALPLTADNICFHARRFVLRIGVSWCSWLMRKLSLAPSHAPSTFPSFPSSSTSFLSWRHRG